MPMNERWDFWEYSRETKDDVLTQKRTFFTWFKAKYQKMVSINAMSMSLSYTNVMEYKSKGIWNRQLHLLKKQNLRKEVFNG